MSNIVQDDYRDDIYTTGALVIGAGVSGLLTAPNDDDWFAVDLTAGSTYEFSISHDGQGIDTPVLGLLDASGWYVQGTKSFWGATSFTAISSGRYYLSVSSFQAANHIPQSVNYTVLVKDGADDDYTANTSTTGKLEIEGKATGVLGTANDVDWFAVDLTAGNSYAFFGGADNELSLGLYDASGSPVTGAYGIEKVGFTAISSGRYYLSVSGGAAGVYSLRSFVDDYSANTSTTGHLTIGSEMSGVIDIFGDEDWLAVDLVAGTTYQFSVDSNISISNFNLNLHDNSGSSISGVLVSSFTGYTPTESGRYYLSINYRYYSQLDNYQARYKISTKGGAYEDYAADTTTKAVLEIGGKITSSLSSSSDIDWFAVDLKAGTTYEFSSLNDGEKYRPPVSIYDHAGSVIEYSIYGDTTGYTPKVSGRYYVSVHGRTAGIYTISAKETDRDDYAGDTSTTGFFKVGENINGILATSNDVDWFAVDLAAGVTYEISGSITNTIFGPYFKFYDSSGIYLDGMRSSGKVTFTPSSSGKYYLSVNYMSPGSYKLSSKQLSPDDYKADTSTTGKLIIGGQTTGLLGVANDEDWFAVDLTAGTTYAFSGSFGSGSSSPALRLYDASGSAIAGTEGTGTAGFTATSSGRYYLSVSGTKASDYTLSATQTVMDDYGANTSTTGKLAIGSQTAGVLGTASDQDWFAIDLTAGTTYAFSGSFDGGGASPTLQLYSASGSSIQGTDGAGTSGFTATSSGRYYLSVSGAKTGNYTLSAKQIAVDDFAANTSTTGKLLVDGQTTGIIEVQNDSDWFAVDLTAGSTYQFSAATSGNLSSVLLHLHSAVGVQIADAGAAGFTPTSSGRYYLSVDGAKGTGQYSISTKKIIIDDYTSNTSTSGKLIPGGNVTGIIEAVKDVDWFAVDLTAGSTYQFAASTSGKLPSVTLSLYDAFGSSIQETKAVGATSFTPTSTGRYYLSVDGEAGEGGYTISSTSVKLPTLSITGSSVREGHSGTKALSFTVSLSEASDQAVTFHFATKGTTATAGVDFQALSDTYTIAPGSRSTVIDVLVNGDTQVEGDEMLLGIISQARGAMVSVSAATGTILNDDFQSAFSLAAYRALNPDLLNAFGNDDAALLRHYLSNGQAENRVTNGFNAEAYAALNPDLFKAFGLNTDALISHYVNYGRAEGRLAEGFDALAYAALNPDLYAVFGTDRSALVNHYIDHGREEGRLTSGFDVEAYAVLNPDLFNAFGLNADALISHYLNYGRAEGRITTGFSAETYAALNPDLFNAFGFNTEALINHYFNYGRAEGRPTDHLPAALAVVGMAEDSAALTYDLAA